MAKARDSATDPTASASEPAAAPAASPIPLAAHGDEEMMRLVSELYYLRDQSQSTIAELTGFSVSKVSRMLSGARDAGIVQISVQPAPETLATDAEALAGALGISDAHITPGRSDDPVRATRLCAVAAAPWLADQLPEAGVLGLAGGFTISSMVDALPPRRRAHLTIVPIVGGWDPATPHLDINELARRTAERLGCRYRLLHAPGRLDSTAVRDALMNDSAIRVTTEFWDRLSVALIGISGGPQAQPGYTTVMDRLSGDERGRLAGEGVVGDMVGHLFSIAGQIVDDPTADRTIAAPIEALRHASRVIAVAAGPHKVDGIIGASRTGLIHTLVTDQPTAEQTLRRLSGA